MFDTTADGLNLYRGIPGVIVEESFFRNYGDDGVASWAENLANTIRIGCADQGADRRNNLNQIARVSHQDGHATSPNREDLRAMTIAHLEPGEMDAFFCQRCVGSIAVSGLTGVEDLVVAEIGVNAIATILD